MKKVFGQTVRDLKRGVNKKVLKVHGVEQKILDATNNESWGPHGTDLAEIAHASRNYHECQLIMTVIWRRVNDTGKNWRHVFKALIVLEYLVAHGSERVIDEIMDHGHQISSLAEFQYIDSNGRDQGVNVRRKSQCLVALVNDKERIREVRLKAQANKDKHDTPSIGGEYSESAYSSTGGHDNNDEHFGNGTDERNGYGDDNIYGRRRNSDEPYERDAYRGDNYRGHGNDDGHFRSRNQNVDGCADSFGKDDDHSSRSSGKIDQSPDEREIERNINAHNVAAPPSYEDVTRNSLDIIEDDRNEETVAASPSALKPTSSSSTVQGAENAATSQTSLTDAFDEFDPRSVSAAQPSASGPTLLDIFGFSPSDSTDPLAMVPANLTASNTPMNSVFGTDFLAASSSSSPASSLPYEDPFGDAPFKAVPQENIQAQPHNIPQGSSFQFQASSSMGGSETLSSAAQNAETFQGFHFGDTLGSLAFGSSAGNGEHASSGFPLDQSSNDILDSILPRTGSCPIFSSHEAQTAASGYTQTDQTNPFQSLGPAGLVVSHGESLTNTQTDQINPFQPSTHTHTAQMNPFQSSVASQEVQINTQHVFPPGLSVPASSQEATTEKQTVQMSSPKQSDPSLEEVSQGLSNNMQASQINFFQPSGPAALQAPITTMQKAQTTSPQQSDESVPSASQGSPNNTQTSQMNLFEPSASQGSPNTMEASKMSFFQPSGPIVSQEPAISMQIAQISYPEQSIPSASQASPTNMQTFQMNFPQSSGFSQPTNMQTAQMNFLQPPGLSAPGFSQQRAQMNMQASHMNYFQPSASQGLHPNIHYHPSASQGFNPTMQRGQMNFYPAASQMNFQAPAAASQMNFQAPPASAASQMNFQAPAASQMNFQAPPASAALQGLQANVYTNFVQPSGPPAQSPANMQIAHLQTMPSDPSTAQAGASLARPTTKPQPSKFETKSTVWADTLTRGLVNLDISGPKTNPLADIGVDFDAINRREKRLEPKSNAPPVASTIVMGKAMGSGTGRSATGGLVAPPTPVMGPGMGMQGMGMGMRGGVGMNMGGSGGMNMGMGMGMGGYGGNMNHPPMGMNMGMGQGQGQGAPMQPPGPGIPGGGYNPMMGMGGYGNQRPYGGGYR